MGGEPLGARSQGRGTLGSPRDPMGGEPLRAQAEDKTRTFGSWCKTVPERRHFECQLFGRLRSGKPPLSNTETYLAVQNHQIHTKRSNLMQILSELLPICSRSDPDMIPI